MVNTPYKVAVNAQHFEVLPETAQDLDIIAVGEQHFHIIKDNKTYRATVVAADQATKTFTLNVNGHIFTTKVSDAYDRLIDQLGMKVGTAQKAGDIKAPMPGMVLEVAVEIGQIVAKGDKVLILEAMKMENVIKAAGDGVVKAIHVSKGMAVEKGLLMVEITEA